jgi:7-carboxy-7-deazaguanine synthase
MSPASTRSTGEALGNRPTPVARCGIGALHQGLHDIGGDPKVALPAPRPVPITTPPSLPVVETFHSLQGEGLHAGRSAFFLRLAGCAVGCPWCDTKHSWELENHPHRSLAELAAEARAAAAAGACFAVITGGEPLEHELAPLSSALATSGLPLHLETSGAAPLRLSGRFDWITLSPKRHRPPSPELLAACHELKVVVHEPADLAYAAAMAELALQSRAAIAAAPAPALLLQPGWNCRRGQELAVDFVRRHSAWRLSLQSHKWLGVR